MPSRLQDPTEKVLFRGVEPRVADLQWFQVPGGHAVVEYAEGVLFLLMGVRNVGTGLAVLRAWRARPGLLPSADSQPAPLESFHSQTRDIYVPAGDTGFWQGAIRDPNDPDRDGVLAAITNREAMTIELLYGDGEGGQRVISRFAVIPAGDEAWLVSVSRHWNLDRDDPR